MRRGEENRRRRRRFSVDGEADLTLIGGQSRLEGQVQEISECGCRIAAGDLLAPGTDLRLSLNIFDISLALKAQVKYMAKNLGVGVEFQEIRQGDRPLLDYLLHKSQNQEHRGVRQSGSCDRAVESGGGGSWIVLTGDSVAACSKIPS
jgi:hypothetical protein